MGTNCSVAKRLEEYTSRRLHEILIVNAEVAGEPDQIAIFRGYSSSLMRPTASDLDVPVLPDNAKIISIERVTSPYNPEAPHYIQQGLTWETIQSLLLEVGV